MQISPQRSLVVSLLTAVGAVAIFGLPAAAERGSVVLRQSSQEAGTQGAPAQFSPETMALLQRADNAANRMERLLSPLPNASQSEAGATAVAVGGGELKQTLMGSGDIKNAALAEASKVNWRQLSIAPGDTLSQVFESNGLGYAVWNKILGLGRQVSRLKNLRAGDQLRLAVDRDDQFVALEMSLDLQRTLRVDRIFGNYQAKIVERPHQTRRAIARGRIKGSFFNAAKKAGLNDKMVAELTGIFAWDIDFAQDLHPGDRFAVVFEKHYIDGKFLRSGKILAAEFTTAGRKVRALRHTDAQGRTAFYSPEGHSLKKAFLRTPGDFTRVSSGFTLRRKHPILKVWRAHKGVDYAAPNGTKIVAAGSGRVQFIGRKGGYGRVVILDHGRGYTTLYAHMSRFAKGLKKGSRVRQGQVIGGVGASGAATGPHLHYEFRVNGVHKDPLTVKLPRAEPIGRRDLPTFRRQASPLLAQLDGTADTKLARLEVDL